MGICIHPMIDVVVNHLEVDGIAAAIEPWVIPIPAPRKRNRQADGLPEGPR
jgi:hypothetical protein